MNELLSQEEIDALLKGNFDNDEDDNSSHSEELTEEEMDALGEIGNISMGTAATTLYTLLGHKVTITTPEVTVTSLAELALQYSIPFVAVEIQYTEGLEGNNLLIMKEDDVKVITDLLMGGDGTNIEGELNELQLSAISEVMNQMMGSAATSLASMFGKDIGISPPNVSTINFEHEKPNSKFDSDDPIVKVNFRMEIPGILDSYIMQLIPAQFARDMVRTLMYGEDDHKHQITSDQTVDSQQKEQLSTGQPFSDQQAAIQGHGAAHSHEFTDKNAYTQGSIEETAAVGVQPVVFQPLEETPVDHQRSNIDLILDVPLQISVELGRTQKKIQDILELNSGSIIELDKLAGEPVDILVNGKIIAKGEVVVIDDNFGVRITDIVSPSNRISNLR